MVQRRSVGPALNIRYGIIEGNNTRSMFCHMEPAFLGSGKYGHIRSIIRLIITDKIASERGATFDHLPGLPMPIQSSLAPRELRSIAEVPLVGCVLSPGCVLCSQTRVDAPPVQSTGPNEA